MNKLNKKVNPISMKNKNILKNILIGFFAGLVSGFFSSGGGLILVPYVSSVLKIEEVNSRATTIFCIFFMVFTSSIFYYKQNYIDWNIGIKCVIGGTIGSIVGSKILLKSSKDFLQISFIIFLIYAGIKMIRS